MDTASISTTVRQIWQNRPLRARGAPIAGVCTGFARRYQVDVALVRTAVIGATLLGGIGFIAYIAGIFLLPKEPDRAYHTEERGGPPPFVLFIAAGIAVLAGGSLNGSWPGAWLISAALLLAGWYALHQRVPVPPPGTAVSSRDPVGGIAAGGWQPPPSPFAWQPAWQPYPAAPGQAPPAARPEPSASAVPTPSGDGDSTPVSPAGAAPDGPAQHTAKMNPPRWDPLGAAPFAWDLPEPSASTAVAAPPRKRSRVTPVTLGVALLAGAVLAAINVLGLASVSFVFGASVILGLIGAGLLFGAFRRSGYGLLFAAIPLAGAVVIGATAQNLTSGFDGVGPGDKEFTVTDQTTLQENYRAQAGNLDLDLSRLALERDQTVRTDVRAGNTSIQVPASMNINVHCRARVGDATCDDGLVRGVGATPDSPTLTIVAIGSLGNVEVTRVQ